MWFQCKEGTSRDGVPRKLRAGGRGDRKVSRYGGGRDYRMVLSKGNSTREGPVVSGDLVR